MEQRSLWQGTDGADGGWWMAEGLDTWTCIWNQKSRWEGRDDKDGVKLDKFLVGVLERKKLAW